MARETDPYRLVKYVATGAIDGILAGWVFVGLLLWFDIRGLWSMASHMETGPLFILILFILTGITFGMLGIAWRVMFLLPHEED